MNVPGYEEKVRQQVRSRNVEKLESLKKHLLLEETAGLSVQIQNVQLD
jgi:hypothetical protein